VVQGLLVSKGMMKAQLFLLADTGAAQLQGALAALCSQPLRSQRMAISGAVQMRGVKAVHRGPLVVAVAREGVGKAGVAPARCCMS
jgi:hypothetical protein